ncbi:uncharacterized protein LOC130657789 [Hydractinia symbiolongicarpus]|uniref:uncharacterized protein LOC130657789 n=1 Tax=Hydractinia symbiolongicarpus TaxID=13093 RepID=UPI002550F32F|nr:uncharacterized protein LOC130657789 [Hydractinia symbiolongicarpus]
MNKGSSHIRICSGMSSWDYLVSLSRVIFGIVYYTRNTTKFALLECVAQLTVLINHSFWCLTLGNTVICGLTRRFNRVYPVLRCIIDCTEVFIERPKSLELQAQTWSDYKSHNTIKFLIGISPTGFITFLSDCYGGRTNERICEDSGFFDALEREDEIMADRGFQIKEDLLLRFCSLSVPPGARIKAQMTTEECKRTKDVANLRIHVKRAINRIKTFRILKYVLPITMLQHADHIVPTCAALCNLTPRLMQAK